MNSVKCVPEGSILSPSLFLMFTNDLCAKRKRMYSFADDRNLCHAFSFTKRHCSNNIQSKHCVMNDTLKLGPHKFTSIGSGKYSKLPGYDNTKRHSLDRTCVQSVKRHSLLKFFKVVDKIVHCSWYPYDLLRLYPAKVRVQLARVGESLQALSCAYVQVHSGKVFHEYKRDMSAMSPTCPGITCIPDSTLAPSVVFQPHCPTLQQPATNGLSPGVSIFKSNVHKYSSVPARIGVNLWVAGNRKQKK